jgi:WD40 repeat protein
MPPRAVDHKPPTDIPAAPDPSQRKVLPFRRDIPVSTTLVESQFESELRDLESEISSLGERPLAAAMARVVERIRSLTHADGAALAVRDEQGVYCLASTGDAPEVGSRLQPDSGLTRECFESAKVVLCEDAEKDSRVGLAIAQSLRLGSALAVPIQHQGSVLGVVEVLSSRPAAFDGTHVFALQRVALALAPVLAPAPPPEKRAPLGLWLAVGVALLLGLGLLSWWALSHRRTTRSLASAVAPSVSAPPGQAEATKGATPSESQTAASAARSLPPEVPAPTSAAPPLQENRGPAVVLPASPALAIKEAPPGAQVFVDGRFIAAVDSGGVATIAKLAPGPHHLLLTLPGYRDYDHDIRVLSGETSTLAARLEPLLPPPTVTEVAKAPPLPAVTGTSPPAALAPVIPVADFVLLRTLQAHGGWVSSVSFTADGQRLVSGGRDQAVKFWDVRSGQQLAALSGEGKEIEALALSRDGHWVAAESPSNTSILWDATTGHEVHTLAGHKPPNPAAINWVYSIAFSPDGRWLASGVDDKTVRLWDVNSGQALRDLSAERRPVIYIAVSPDGRWLASGRDSKTIEIWEVATGQVVRTLSGHKKDVYAVAFSPQGQRLASASGDKTVKLWDLASGREVRTLTGHRDRVTTLAFSPDGRWLATGSWDKTIKIWDVESGRELQTVAGNRGHIYTVAFDSRGRWLASGSEDGAIQLWRLRQDQAATQLAPKGGVENGVGSAVPQGR